MSSSFQAAIFDMDGVITHTADLHAAAWKELFDDLLRARRAKGSHTSRSTSTRNTAPMSTASRGAKAFAAFCRRGGSP